jgi:glutamate N-acetyltransferase/amino-acid N-acetyltransferase
MFTRNAFAAAPVLYSQANLLRSGGLVRAILVNSGNANAATGKEGIAASRRCAECAASFLKCSPDEVFIASTGVIGRPLPAKKICDAVPSLVASLSVDGSDVFSRSIMTTDTFPKIASANCGAVRILGFAKGAGMIHPNMATMLSFILTDAKIKRADLSGALQTAVDRSFHSISVDGDTSTNDTVAVLANGASGVIPDPAEFPKMLSEVCEELAKAIVRDGEGATKLIELFINGAPNEQAAREIGRTIARSPLVKTAIYGCDPNWGRIIGAIGNSGIALNLDRIGLYIDDIPLIGGDLDRIRERMNAKNVRIRVDLNAGPGKARVWTCDLTEDYIRINADYTT